MRHATHSAHGVSGSFSDPNSSKSENSLLAILPTARFFCGEDISFYGVCLNDKEITPGSLAVYRIGKSDPETFLANALARGAAGILTEQLLPSPLPQCIVGDADLALADISAAITDHPDREMLTVGVVGESGKTTTSLIIATLLRSFGIRTAYQTDLGQCDGIVQSTPDQTMPSGAELVDWLAEVRDADSKAAVIEVNEADCKFGRYDSIQFDLLIVTGRGSEVDQPDYGPTGIQCAIDRLAPGGAVVVCADNQRAVRVVRDAGVNMTTYGVRNEADVTAKIIDHSGGVSTLMITSFDTSAMMETTLCGAAMAANHAAAICAGLLLEFPLTQIIEATAKLRSIPGRGQLVSSDQHARAILDVGGNAHRIADVLRTARASKHGGRLRCVLAIDGNTDPNTLAEFGHLVERFADDVVISAASSSESFLKASHALLDGVKKCAAIRLVADYRRAVRWTVSQARPGDTVLVLGGIETTLAAKQRKRIEEIVHWIEDERAHLEAPERLHSKTPKLTVYGG